MSFLFHVPVCVNNPWPTDLESCLNKFQAYNARMKKLFMTRDRLAEQPRPFEWSMTPGKNYTSACILWDVLHVYHMMGTIYWNEAMNFLNVKKDQRQAKLLFVEAHKYFSSIAQKIIPQWLPACRVAYQLTNKTLVIPTFLIGNNWTGLTVLCNAMISRCCLEKTLYEGSSSALICKIAVGGYKVLSGHNERLEPKEANDFFESQKQTFKWYSIFYWTRGDEDPENVGIKIKALTRVSDQMKKTVDLKGLEDIKAETQKWEKLNGSVYFQVVPSDYDEDVLLSGLTSINLNSGLDEELDCCVL